MNDTLFIVALCLISLWLFYASHYGKSFSGFQCSGVMVHRGTTPAGTFAYTVQAKMFFTNRHDGFYALNGSFDQDGQLYNLHRTRFFSYRQKNNPDLYEITITRENISVLDNLPATLNTPVLLPVGDSILSSFRPIDNSAILVSLFYSPFFVCAKD